MAVSVTAPPPGVLCSTINGTQFVYAWCLRPDLRAWGPKPEPARECVARCGPTPAALPNVGALFVKCSGFFVALGITCEETEAPRRLSTTWEGSSVHFWCLKYVGSSVEAGVELEVVVSVGDATSKSKVDLRLVLSRQVWEWIIRLELNLLSYSLNCFGLTKGSQRLLQWVNGF